MSSSTGDTVALDHLARNPQAQHRALHDPQYAQEVHRLRQVLDHLDTALADEGLPAEARQRIGARLVADYLGTDQEHARARAAQQLLAQGLVRVPSRA